MTTTSSSLVAAVAAARFSETKQNNGASATITATASTRTAIPAPSTDSLDRNCLVTPLSIRLAGTAPRIPPDQYDDDPELYRQTRLTRTLFGQILPIGWQQYLRDMGGFRWMADTLVSSLGVPFQAVRHPTALYEYLAITHQNYHRRIYYGTNTQPNKNKNKKQQTTTTAAAAGAGAAVQFIDVFLPTNNTNTHGQTPTSSPPTPPRGMIYFVHGGAWGSGRPWYYRLIARPFLAQDLAVAIIGYRVYPVCGSAAQASAASATATTTGGVQTQIEDLEAAFQRLVHEYPDWCCRREDPPTSTKTTKDHTTTAPPHLGVVVMGHSSGAHIALLWLVERAKHQLLRATTRTPTTPTRQSQHQQHQQHQQQGSRTTRERTTTGTIAAYIGISGVYNINHHYDYEAARGVSEFSPLKPTNGMTRANFLRHTPQYHLQHDLVRIVCEDDAPAPTTTREGGGGGGGIGIAKYFPPRMLLIHGMDDATVPFTSTGEAARLLRQCAGAVRGTIAEDDGPSTIIDEYYVPKCSHQDTVVDLMLRSNNNTTTTTPNSKNTTNGPVTTTILQWLFHTQPSKPPSQQQQPQQQPPQRRGRRPTSSATTTATTVLHSKL